MNNIDLPDADSPRPNLANIPSMDDMLALYEKVLSELDSAISMLDSQIGKVMQAVTYREQTYKEDWLVIITTDHGRDKETGKDHGGQSDSERNTWMVMNKKPNNYALNNRTAIVDIFPTITAFLNISLPSHIAQGLDGVPLLVTFR